LGLKKVLGIILLVILVILLFVTIGTLDFTISLFIILSMISVITNMLRGQRGSLKTLSKVERDVVKAIFSGFRTVDLISGYTGHSKVKVEMALRSLMGKGIVEHMKVGGVEVYRLKEGKLPVARYE